MTTDRLANIRQHLTNLEDALAAGEPGDILPMAVGVVRDDLRDVLDALDAAVVGRGAHRHGARSGRRGPAMTAPAALTAEEPAWWPLAQHMTERELLRAVMEMAQRFGWLTYHTWRSDHSEAGFPDCAFVRDGLLVLAELKRESGKTTVEQRWWLDSLGSVQREVARLLPGEARGYKPQPNPVRVVLWRPRHWYSGEIEATLRGERP